MQGVKTTKPVATISFNSPEYLRQTLNDLVEGGRISFWAFIVHQPEDDEGGTKEHAHVYVEPAKMMQTDDLRQALREYDPAKPDKPRGTLTWGSSKFGDWYMYGLHDKRYLASKGQARKYHYGHDQIQTSDPDDLLCKSRQIDLLGLSPYADMQDAVEHGITWKEYFARGTVPLPQLKAFEYAFNLLSANYTYRAAHPGHPDDVTDEFRQMEQAHQMEIDPETGEVH